MVKNRKESYDAGFENPDPGVIWTTSSIRT